MRRSLDLHKRVVEFVRDGGSKAEAARRFKVGETSVYRWLKPVTWPSNLPETEL